MFSSGTTYKPSHMTPGLRIVMVLLFMYRLGENNIGYAGAQALAGGLQHCTNLQIFKLVIYVLTHHILHFFCINLGTVFA